MNKIGMRMKRYDTHCTKIYIWLIWSDNEVGNRQDPIEGTMVSQLKLLTKVGSIISQWVLKNSRRGGSGFRSISRNVSLVDMYN